jgi:Fe-S-cluster containining protein
MNKLNQIALDNISSQIVSCKGCTKCCEKGLVYILPEECKSLESIGVPLIEIDGITFIQRKSDGSCSMLDKQHSRCTIYENRPMCCRAFPLDVFSRNGKLEWAIYTYCPTDRIIPIRNNDGKAGLDFLAVSRLATLMEQNIPEKVFHFLEQEDKIAAEVELLDEYKDEYKILGNITKDITI